MGSFKQVRPELSPGQVQQAVMQSTGDDWLYFPRERVYSFRRDLLIRMERVSPERSRIFYGAVPVGDAAIEEEQRGEVVDATLHGEGGETLVALRGIPLVHDTEDEPAPTEFISAERMIGR